MSMKTMLIPTEQRTSMSSTLQTALLLARRFDSYVEGFALQPAISELLAVDMVGSFAPESFKQDGESCLVVLAFSDYSLVSLGALAPATPICRLDKPTRRPAWRIQMASITGGVRSTRTRSPHRRGNERDNH